MEPEIQVFLLLIRYSRSLQQFSDLTLASVRLRVVLEQMHEARLAFGKTELALRASLGG